MIAGYIDAHGSPFLDCVIYFPPPVDRVVRVEVLVDTGASRTSIGHVDLRQLRARLPHLRTRESSHYMVGVGGTSRPLLTSATLHLTHQSRETSSFTLDLAILEADTPNLALPSLLGMDVLRHGVLTVDGPTAAVSFDVPAQDFVLPVVD